MVEVMFCSLMIIGCLVALAYAMSRNEPHSKRHEQILEKKQMRHELTAKIWAAKTDKERDELLGQRFKLDCQIEMLERWG